MTTTTVPTTELDAVNLLLSVIGETPINTLDEIAFTDAAIARDKLVRARKQVLSTGWYFNTDDAFTFVPDVDGHVVVPPNVLKVRPGTDEDRRIVPRNGKLYDRDAQSDTFDADKPPVMNAVWDYEYETLPETFRIYIAIHAARQFQTAVMGSDQLYVYSQDEEGEARAAIWREQAEYEPANFVTDDQDTQSIWMR